MSPDRSPESYPIMRTVRTAKKIVKEKDRPFQNGDLLLFLNAGFRHEWYFSVMDDGSFRYRTRFRETSIDGRAGNRELILSVDLLGVIYTEFGRTWNVNTITSVEANEEDRTLVFQGDRRLKIDLSKHSQYSSMVEM